MEYCKHINAKLKTIPRVKAEEATGLNVKDLCIDLEDNQIIVSYNDGSIAFVSLEADDYAVYSDEGLYSWSNLSDRVKKVIIDTGIVTQEDLDLEKKLYAEMYVRHQEAMKKSRYDRYLELKQEFES